MYTLLTNRVERPKNSDGETSPVGAEVAQSVTFDGEQVCMDHAATYFSADATTQEDIQSAVMAASKFIAESAPALYAIQADELPGPGYKLAVHVSISDQDFESEAGSESEAEQKLAAVTNLLEAKQEAFKSMTEDRDNWRKLAEELANGGALKTEEETPKESEEPAGEPKDATEAGEPKVDEPPVDAPVTTPATEKPDPKKGK